MKTMAKFALPIISNTMKENKIFTPEQLENFVHEHIQQKIDNNELHLSLSRFDMKHPKAFKRSFQIYENALFEGLVNGIVMCGGKVEGIDT